MGGHTRIETFKMGGMGFKHYASTHKTSNIMKFMINIPQNDQATFIKKVLVFELNIGV